MAPSTDLIAWLSSDITSTNIGAGEFATQCAGAKYRGHGQKNVTFYRNLELLGVVEMPRQLTDCNNGPEGILLGDPGLALGQVRVPTHRLS